MGDEDGIDHRQDVAIALLGEFGGNAALAGSKGRNKQQRARFDAGFKVSGYTVILQASLTRGSADLASSPAITGSSVSEPLRIYLYNSRAYFL